MLGIDEAHCANGAIPHTALRNYACPRLSPAVTSVVSRSAANEHSLLYGN